VKPLHLCSPKAPRSRKRRRDSCFHNLNGYRYDYILLDSPPVMAVSDAVLLSTMVEGVILVINVQATPKRLLREACARLNYARAKMVGTVLNRAELRAGAYAYY
jgi:Mrp family chromosome partitioning ATPase